MANQFESVPARGEPVRLYNGEATNYDGTTTYNLIRAYTEFTFLLIVTQTNAEKQYQLVKTDTIESGKAVIFYAASSATSGQVSGWSYQSNTKVYFASSTTFKQVCEYTNVNWVNKVVQIWGI